MVCISVSDSELKRLREAFKRLSPVNGAITKHSFIKEVLGDGVPLSIADVCYSILVDPLMFCYVNND